MKTFRELSEELEQTPYFHLIRAEMELEIFCHSNPKNERMRKVLTAIRREIGYIGRKR